MEPTWLRVGIVSSICNFESLIHSKLPSIIYGNQIAHDITEFYSVNMDAWYYRISVACDIME